MEKEQKKRDCFFITKKRKLKAFDFACVRLTLQDNEDVGLVVTKKHSLEISFPSPHSNQRVLAFLF